jgi:hypothetical protein
MKKILFVIAFSAVLAGTACSGGGAFSKEEKDTQDVADSVRQTSGFEALENAASSDSASANTDSTAGKN